MNYHIDMVIHQHSRKLLMMDILMSETCWAHKWNKITSDMKLVFHSSFITMMHGPINIRNCYVRRIHQRCSLHCFALHTKWNKITSDIKLVFHSSTVTISVLVRLKQCHWITIFDWLTTTNSTETNPSWKANRFSDSQEIPRILLEQEGSLLHTQQPATCPYPEPD